MLLSTAKDAVPQMYQGTEWTLSLCSYRIIAVAGGRVMDVDQHQSETNEVAKGVILSSSPGTTVGEKAKGAALRALRTLVQGVAAAFPAAGVGSATLAKSYWLALGYSGLTAVITALVSFLNNVATFLPEDQLQKAP